MTTDDMGPAHCSTIGTEMAVMAPAWRAIGPERDRVGESPVWCVAQQALYWVDIEGRQIHRHEPGGHKALQSWSLGERVGSIALAPNGRVLAAMETGLALLSLEPGGRYHQQMLASIQHPAPGMRFNDGRCDAQGRFWVGTMEMDMGQALATPRGALYCLDERGLTGPYVQGLVTPNGLAFSPDGRTLYLSDSHPGVQKIWAFDIDPVQARLGRRRLWVDMAALPGRPDGAAVDSQGRYWSCANDAGQVHCFSPQGVLLQSLALPLPKPSMCAFGGPDLGTLFITSIVPGDPSTDPEGLSGAVLALSPGVTGRAEPLFHRVPPLPG